MNSVLHQLRRVVLLSGLEGLSDAQLLDAFLRGRDEVAFEAILRRHGRLVLGVCRRVLRNVHDAEDAFQATFLVLARKASSIRSSHVLASWLYGVAYRTAMKARAMSMKRQRKERQVAERPDTFAPAEPVSEELLERLDHELNRLAEKYRVPVVLCELEGKGRKEVARMLGVPEGTLSWRLAQAKKLLARRLSRYGTVAVTALLAEGAASARLSPMLLQSTAQAVGKAGTVPAQVLALSEGILKAMLLTKLKITFCAAGLMLLAGLAATELTYPVTAQQPAAEPPSKGENFGLFRESRPANDDLDALRLEIESLRKELRATKERVKVLEAKVDGPRGAGATEPKRAEGFRRPESPYDAKQPPRGRGADEPKRTDEYGRRYENLRSGLGQPPRAEDPFAAAEDALNRLRRNAADKQAADDLERALKQLKQRERQRPSFEKKP
jgi:RNA polymerase sigma factor (sigma-70 family)